MTHFREAGATFKDQPSLHLELAADEYRLLADLLLNYIGTDSVRNEQLQYLAQRLFVLAVQADHPIPKVAL